MRPLRSGPSGQLYEITTKTLNDRFFLRPSKEVNDTILGCVARAQLIWPIEIHAFVFMSNHYHLLVSAQSAKRLSAFMCHLNGNVSRELNRLLKREGKLWRRRFRSVPVSLETRAQKARLRYLLKHGVKERLVRRPRDWPGASSLPWLTTGAPLRGRWRDRTAEYRVNRSRPPHLRVDMYIDYTIRMTPLPCWVNETMETWQAEVRQMILEIEHDAANASSAWTGPALGREFGTWSVLGRSAVLRTDPWDRPRTPSRSIAPMCHAADAADHARMRRRILDTRDAYKVASAAFRRGQHDVEFPHGTHRPLGMFASWPGVDESHVCEDQQPQVVREWSRPRAAASRQ